MNITLNKIRLSVNLINVAIVQRTANGNLATGIREAINFAVPMALAICLASAVNADPGPGDVYREYVWVAPGGQIPVYDPGATGVKPEDVRQPITVNLDLKGATRAEISFEYWGGHIGTSGQLFLINGASWTQIPQPVGTPTAPERYYRCLLGTPAVPIPLPELKQGDNAIRFTAGPQIAYNFNLGFYHMCAFVVRVYYSKSYPHAAATIAYPTENSSISILQPLKVKPLTGSQPITQVDYFGNYVDFNWSGDGKFREWHHWWRLGKLGHILSSSDTTPFPGSWDNSWVPDQKDPVQIMARVEDVDGIYYNTPIVGGLHLVRKNSVRMYKAMKIPECFASNWWFGPKQCQFKINDPLSKAASAKFVMSDWSFSHAQTITFNGHQLAKSLGIEHEYSLEQIKVPTSWLRQGLNTFAWNNTAQNHPAEVNWPGPVLLVQYKGRLTTSQTVAQASRL
jgi:hypothetical protein